MTAKITGEVDGLTSVPAVFVEIESASLQTRRSIRVAVGMVHDRGKRARARSWLNWNVVDSR